MELRNFHQFGGGAPELSALRRVMVFQRAICRQTSEAPSEAMLFGVAGGVGLSVNSVAPTPELSFGPNYQARPGELLQQLCVRLGLPASFRRARDVAGARRNMLTALEQGDPVIAYARQDQLPQLYRSPGAHGGQAHAFVVYGLSSDGSAQVSDITPDNVVLSGEDLARALGSVPGLLTVSIGAPAGAIDLSRCVEAGVRACYERLIDPPHPRDQHGLPAIPRWASALGDSRDPASWARLYPTGGAIYRALVATYLALMVHGADADAGRGAFARFLREAAEVLDHPAFMDVARRYEALSERWLALGRALLPDDMPLLSETRSLLSLRERLLRDPLTGDPSTAADATDRLDALAAHADDDLRGDGAMRDLLAGAREQVFGLHGVEEEAVRVLRFALR